MKQRFRQQGILSFAFMVLGLTVAVVLGCHPLVFTPPGTIAADATPNFRLMAEAWNTIERVYVDRASVKPQLMTYGAIRGLVDALGDKGHSRFLTPERVKQYRILAEGELEGIGVKWQVENSQAVIVAPMDNSPAQRAGLKPGDIILEVNGESVSGLPREEVSSRLWGPPGTLVKLTILNPKTGHTSEVNLNRARITIRSVIWNRLPGTIVAHLRIATFSKGVTHDLQKALHDIQEEKLTGLILDLRNNSGGLLNEAIGTASQFLESGDVLLKKDSTGKITPVPVQPGGVAVTFPTVCLVNGGSASAAEIVAGALKDAHRATLVGEKTFGTGTMMKLFSLSDGSALLLAFQEWLTPDGHLIWHRGISPDITVPLPPEVTALTPDAERSMTAAELRESKDIQLLRALDLLTRSTSTEQRN